MSDEKLFHYTGCGLDNVWLVDGYRVTETDYGSGVAIDRADELHHVIAKAIIDRPTALLGQEARFLRKLLDLSQADMGKLLGVDRTTVIRWEKAREKPVGKMADLALRYTYAARNDMTLIGSVVKALQDADEQKHSVDYRAVFKSRNAGWQPAEAA